jgi:hypothetical protein
MEDKHDDDNPNDSTNTEIHSSSSAFSLSSGVERTEDYADSPDIFGHSAQRFPYYAHVQRSGSRELQPKSRLSPTPPRGVVPSATNHEHNQQNNYEEE